MVRELKPGELPEYALDVVTQAVVTSGYPIRVTEELGLGYDSRLRMAGRRQPFHHLVYLPQYRPHMLHFLMSAAFKISRVFELPPEERLMPTMKERGRLSDREERELRRKLGNIPPGILTGLSSFLYHGMVQQLTSMPMDIRVEREIAGRLPDHRTRQATYLSMQVRDLVPHFDERIREVAPDCLYAAGSAMNIVLAEEAAEIAGVETPTAFSESPHLEQGRRLRQVLQETTEPGYRGDRAVIEAWATELRMRNWYGWNRLDEVR